MSWRFGIFEFEPASGQLCRNGAPVRLQAQPAQVLGLLLRGAGKVVTRAELKDEVWGSDTFVDFDRGLNFCIAQIRAALGDSADAPVYIRTIPKRGYQFIAPVTSFGEDSADAGEVVSLPEPMTRRKGFWLVWVALLMVLCGGLIVWGSHAWRVQSRESASLPSIRVAVARFDNETGDAALDRLTDALSDSVTAKLTVSGAGRYGVIGNAAILRVPRDQRDLTAIGSSLSAGYVILAQVRRDSTRTFVLAHLIHLPDQTHLAVTQQTCPAGASLQDQSDIAQHIADRFSPLIGRVDGANPPHKTL